MDLKSSGRNVTHMRRVSGCITPSFYNPGEFPRRPNSGLLGTGFAEYNYWTVIQTAEEDQECARQYRLNETACKSPACCSPDALGMSDHKQKCMIKEAELTAGRSWSKRLHMYQLQQPRSYDSKSI